MTVQGTYTPGDAAARDAARRLMQDPKTAISYEPASPSECHAAVDELAAAFSAAGETFKEMVDNSRGGAESLSTDSFQGLSEIVQNANDAGATSVAFSLSGSVLEVQHNGRPVDLRRPGAWFPVHCADGHAKRMHKLRHCSRKRFASILWESSAILGES